MNRSNHFGKRRVRLNERHASPRIRPTRPKSTGPRQPPAMQHKNTTEIVPQSRLTGRRRLFGAAHSLPSTVGFMIAVAAVGQSRPGLPSAITMIDVRAGTASGSGPNCTMVFQVKDPALLDSVKVGDQVIEPICRILSCLRRFGRPSRIGERPHLSNPQRRSVGADDLVFVAGGKRAIHHDRGPAFATAHRAGRSVT
jgi:hypothetical protein